MEIAGVGRCVAEQALAELTSRGTPRARYCLHRAFMTPGEQRVSVSTGISCALGGIRTPSLLIRRKVLADQPVLPGAPAWDESPGHRDTVPRAVPLNRPCRSEPCAARYKSRYRFAAAPEWVAGALEGWPTRTADFCVANVENATPATRHFGQRRRWGPITTGTDGHYSAHKGST